MNLGVKTTLFNFKIMRQKFPEFEDVQIAYNRIEPYVKKTPVLTSSSVNEILGCSVYFKCENFQKVGAFKFRGASNAVLSLSEKELKKGVATHSSGNHAAALALAAKNAGVPSYIVMPENAPEIKKKAVAGYGAEIIFCEPTLEARELNLKDVIDKTGATFVHPYDNFYVIAGQGTAVMDLIEEIGNPDVMMCPVGGGGLLSGTSIATKMLAPNCRIIAGEPDEANDAWKSFTTGEFHPSVNPKTIADGLLTSLGELTFPIIQKNVDEIITVSEALIIQAMRLIWERMKIIIEPSSAVPVAAILKDPNKFAGKRVGLIISGGNVDLEKLPF